jgi:hypothetical protein
MAQDPSGSSKDPKGKQKGESAQPASPQSTGGAPPASGQGEPAAVMQIDPEKLKEILQALAAAGGLPITVAQAPLNPIDLRPRLVQLTPVTVAFPPCSDVLLALINRQTTPKDDITKFFEEYFTFGDHAIVFEPPGSSLGQVLDTDLLNCLLGITPITGEQGTASSFLFGWPSPWCLPPSCVTLNGNRRLEGGPFTSPGPANIKRLFLGDLLWLFFFERMGIFKILGVILDDYATRGGYPISNGSLQPDQQHVLRDDVTALVLEAMCRQTKAGLSSTVRDRDASYRRAWGWTSDVGRPLGLPTQVNKGMSQLFHKFLQAAISFNTAKRLAVAIRGTISPGTTAASLATLVEISDTLTQLKQRFEYFHYGRSYYNTLSGIVWTIAGLTVLRELRTTLGIPAAFNEPHEFIPAAYDLLVLKRPPTQTEVNRYEVHKDLATFGRNLLLDIEVLNEKDITPVVGELERWLAQVEGDIEAYRKAYRDLTGVDLGAPGTPAIEQEA